MKTILIVEDDKYLSQALKVNLEKDGYEVIIANNGIEGLLMLKSQKVDMVLLDIVMPEMDGISMLSRLKQQNGTLNIPIIILTNLESVAYPDGVSDVLLKANTPLENIVKKVKSLLND